MKGSRVGVFTAAGGVEGAVASVVNGAGGTVATGEQLDAVVVDATALTVESAERLWSATGAALQAVKRGGRAVVLASSDSSVVADGCHAFVKSVTREAGGAGVGVNLLCVGGSEVEGRLAGPLSFLAAADSAFVTGQRLEATGAVPPPAAAAPLDGKVRQCVYP